MTERCGLIVAHGDLAEGLLSALTRVAGAQESLWALSNEGLAGEALLESVRSILDEKAGDREVFLFADLDGGSCGRVCHRLLEEGRVRAIFYGVNLPLLIEFVFLDDIPAEKLIPLMLNKSRSALGVRP
ncbi:MAG: PTS sugar transporter subunit IIA [Gemmatimonadota bacterium]